MNTEAVSIFSNDEKEILQEIMNIAFGNATANLADVIDIYVVLSVPDIQVINIGDLPEFINNAIDANGKTVIVDQKFRGDFNGSGFLVFPQKTSDDLESIFDDENNDSYENNTGAAREKGVLIEIGNILISACVGKVSELLNTFVTYSPPQILSGDSNDENSWLNNFGPNQAAIAMQTVFKFHKQDLKGFLLILTNQESIGWLRKSLNDFMNSYE